jgi:hypothetical protein
MLRCLVLSVGRSDAVDNGSKRVRKNMLLARFCRCDSVPADPERESDNFDSADAVSDFDQRPRPSIESHLMGRPNVGGCLYRLLWATSMAN